MGNIVNVKNRGLGVKETRFKARLTLNKLLIPTNFILVKVEHKILTKKACCDFKRMSGNVRDMHCPWWMRSARRML